MINSKMIHNLLRGSDLAKGIYDSLRVENEEILRWGNKKLMLAIVQVGDHPCSNRYIQIKKKKIDELGWAYDHIKLSDNLSDKIGNTQFAKELSRLAEDENVDGIIVQLPLPENIDKKYLELIPYDKDVDGVTIINQGMLFKGGNEEEYIAPCTAKACLHFLHSHRVNLSGAHVGVLGRSFLVGKPIAMLLQNNGASVVTLHQNDVNQQVLTKQCDVLISAIGKPNYITCDYVKEGAFVVDIGVTQVNGKMVGDVHPEVANYARAVSPSVDGIGPLTVAFLMSNLLKCYKLSF